MERIKESDLKAVINRINVATGSPVETYAKDEKGQYKANVGNYHLSMAYGGYKLERISNDAGGVPCPINTGFTTKRDLYNQLRSFLAGLSSK